MNQSRRRFAGGLALLGAGQALGLWSPPAAAEPPPETKRIRVKKDPNLCEAPATETKLAASARWIGHSAARDAGARRRGRDLRPAASVAVRVASRS